MDSGSRRFMDHDIVSHDGTGELGDRNVFMRGSGSRRSRAKREDCRRREDVHRQSTGGSVTEDFP